MNDRYMSKQTAIDKLKPYSRYLIKNVYDKLDFGAILSLVPEFEYPDWDYRKVRRLWRGK